VAKVCYFGGCASLGLESLTCSNCIKLLLYTCTSSQVPTCINIYKLVVELTNEKMEITFNYDDNYVIYNDN